MMNSIHRFFSIPVAVAVFILIAACAEPAPPVENQDDRHFQRRSLFMGTILKFEIISNAPETEIYRVYEKAIRRLSDLEQMMSWHLPTSELRRINSNAAEKPISVSPEFSRLFALASEYHTQTRGSFDITVKPLLELYGFYRRELIPVDAENLAKLAASLGLDHVHFDAPAGRISFSTPQIQLDFGGMIKGVALDYCVETLRTGGFTNFHLDFGGSSHYASGVGTGSGWKVSISAPHNRNRPIASAVLNESALSVSWNRSAGSTSAPDEFSLILDPRSGTLAPGPKAVIVVAPRGSTSDVWSTALCVDPGLLDGVPLAAAGLSAIAISQEGQALTIRDEAALPCLVSLPQ